MTIIWVVAVRHWHVLFCTASGSDCPSCGSTWHVRGARAGFQHTLTARGTSFARGLRRAIIIQAGVVVVVIGLQEICWAHGNMMFGMMMFCKIVSAVGRTAAPVDEVLTLPDAVADPVKTHVHSFGTFLFN